MKPRQTMVCICTIVGCLQAVECLSQDASARAIVVVPRAYVIRARYRPNTVNGPHYHPADEEITILSGTLYFGRGPTVTPEETMALPAGSFIAQPAKGWHFLFTKAEPVELEIRGIGPRANVYAK